MYSHDRFSQSIKNLHQFLKHRRETKKNNNRYIILYRSNESANGTMTYFSYTEQNHFKATSAVNIIPHLRRLYREKNSPIDYYTLGTHGGESLLSTTTMPGHGSYEKYPSLTSQCSFPISKILLRSVFLSFDFSNTIVTSRMQIGKTRRARKK